MSGQSGSGDQPEPRYAREVFERLRETLDVLLTDDAVIAGDDSHIKPNYDLREDGAWLRPNGEEDSLNWTPACDMEEAPNSPDPLTTPALPFPFTARHLAAFMLDGWGWVLHSRFADQHGQVDRQTLRRLLGGVRDAKPREAIAGAFAALARARQHVGDPDATLADAQQAARTAFEEAEEAAEQLHDWREPGISEPERNARVQRRNELTAAKWLAFKHAREARENDEASWRREVVRWLLAARERKASKELADAQFNDETLTGAFAGHAPVLNHVEVSNLHVDWHDATIRANYWFALQSVTAVEAAQLLSCSNPQDPASANWLETTDEHMNPAAKRELLRGFEDVGGVRTLLGWLQQAKSRGWRYDPWIDQYVEDAHLETTASSDDAPDTPVPVSRARAQEAAILAKFKELGIDPMRLPRPKRGASSPPVASVRAALGYTTDVMQKAMSRLFEDDRAAYCGASAD